MAAAFSDLWAQLVRKKPELEQGGTVEITGENLCRLLEQFYDQGAMAERARSQGGSIDDMFGDIFGKRG